MMSLSGAPRAGKVTRKRKAHTKSRRGCGNCKLRQVKCDERKPSCTKCLGFGVSCDYGHRTTPGESVLQFSVQGPFHTDIMPSPSVNTTIRGVINASLAQRAHMMAGKDLTYELTSHDFDILSRFHSRTILTLSTSTTICLYQKESIRLACMHPFLMHLAISLTMMHDRHLLSSQPPPPSSKELSHLYLGTAAFNRKLSSPLTSSDRDAVWGAATFLGASTFARMEATVPEQAWPLRKPAEDDLEWLNMYNGKREIWRLVDPLRPDSCFRPVAQEVSFLHNMPVSDPELKELPSELVQLLGLDGCLDTSVNPYRIPANILNNLMPMENTQATLLRFFSFISLMPPDFKQLVHEKDPCALLLMAYWHAKFSHYRSWHIWRRAILEGQAICMYLGKYHADIPHLDLILKFPRKICGVSATGISI
ncbi:hypothetical protein GQ53DRAFT_844797 [Thozetella sp. PMI_491]|nr:hypothetical protein GQ53DRAFT_844797 [Thozetella sp. PMI_491]